MPVDPIIVAGAVGGISVAATAIYAYTTGEDASASVDVDDDGTDEAEVNFSGAKDNEEYVAENPDSGTTDETTSTPPNPTPDEVIDKSGLTDIKGIQETRAKNLGKAGFSTPADVYYASDENLEVVDQIGPYTVEQIREDIGGVDEDPNGKSSEEASDDSQDSTDQTEADEPSESSQSEQDAE